MLADLRILPLSTEFLHVSNPCQPLVMVASTHDLEVHALGCAILGEGSS